VDWSEAKFTIRPQPFSFIAGTSAALRKNGHGEVEVDRHVPALGRDGVGLLAGVDPGGMDKDVGRAEGLGARAARSASPSRSVRSASIAATGPGASLCREASASAPACDADDLRAGAAEHQRRAPPEAGACPGHAGDA
jgi:hypothetical protein